MEKFDAGKTVFCTIVILVLALAAPPVHSATWYVNDGDTTGDTYTTSPGSDAISDTQNSSDTPFRTISRAINALNGDGDVSDTILVDSGTYNEQVTFDTSDLRIVGAGTEATRIDSGIFKTSLTTRSDITISKLSVRGSPDEGIRIDDATNLEIVNVFSKNTGRQGFYFENVSNAFVNDAVSTGASGEGVFLTNVTQSILKNVEAHRSQRDGIYLEDSPNNDLTNLTSTQNNASGINLTLSSDSVDIKLSSANFNTNHGIEVSSSLDFEIRTTQGDSNGQNGIFVSPGSDNGRILYNRIWNNGQNGLRIVDSNDLTVLLNDLRRNGNYQMNLGSSASLTFQSKNNIIPSTTHPDSGLLNNSGQNLTVERNWWGTPDSAAIRNRTVSGSGNTTDYIPFRLAPVDTSVGADTLAPALPDNIRADTAFPGRVEFTWDGNNNLEEETRYPNAGYDISGFRIYRSQNQDTTDWKDALIQDQDRSDTDFVDTGVQTDTTYYYRMTAYDSEGRFGNESYFSRIFKVTVPSTGPAIYVNDDSTAGDVFTTNTGNDSNVGIAQHPVRTIEQAFELAQDGDTIYVDAGTYAAGASVDTPNITMVGAGQALTHLDGSTGVDTGLTVNGGNFHVRELTVQNYGRDGMVVSGGNLRATNITFRNNGDNGLQFSGGSNGYVAQATFDSNANAQVHFSGGDSNTVQYSNIFPSPNNPDSGVTNTSGNPNPVFHNWWTTTDSDAINQHVSGPSDYIPHRLGIVDTGVNADTIAPAAPMLSVDTSVAQQLSLNWPAVNSDENGRAETGHEGYRVFKIEGVGDTPDWTAHRVATLSPSDTRWVDTNVTKSQPYSYRMTSFDTAMPENESYFSSVRSGTWFNRPPVPDPLSLVTQVDSPVGFTVSGTDADGDTLTFRLDDPPANGTISGTLPVATYRPDTNFTGVDTFTFVITDGQDTSVAETVTVNVATLLKVNVSNITTTATDTSTPAIANGTDTVGINVTYKNTGTGTGIVRRDTDQLRVLNALGRNVADSFNIVMSGTDARVPVGDTTTTHWVIHTPTTSPDSAGVIGNFRTGLIPDRVTLEDAISGDQQTLADTPPNRRTVPFQIISEPDTYNPSPPDNGLDNLSIFNQTISFIGGLDDNESMFDITGTARDGDSVIVVLQRGEVNPDQNVNTLDTPTLDPDLGIQSKSEFENAVKNADENLIEKRVSGSVDFVDTGLFSVSIWLNKVGSTYIGDAADLSENVVIRINNVSLPPDVTQPDRLEIVKLVNDGGWKWKTVAQSPQFSNGTIEFTVSSNTAENYAGFSVFRIITSGFSTSGTADETVVYPNPFVPTDGNPRTGSYGGGKRDGIHFGAGPDRGFPPNTTIKIYTIRGQLVDKETTNSGGIIQWDAHTENGDPAASGVYIYRIEVPNRGDKVGKFAIVR